MPTQDPLVRLVNPWGLLAPHVIKDVRSNDPSGSGVAGQGALQHQHLCILCSWFDSSGDAQVEVNICPVFFFLRRQSHGPTGRYAHRNEA